MGTPSPVETGTVQEKTPFDWVKFWQNFVSYAALITIGMAILGGVFGYALHVSEQIGDLKDRQGKLEGKMEMFLQQQSNP